jgi:hypothetical protein
MAAVIAMLTRMKLSAEAAGEITSATGQAISAIPDFAEMDKEGVDLVFRQLARPGGANAAGVRNPGIKISAIGQQPFGLMTDAIEQWNKGHRGVDGSLLGYVTRKAVNLFPEAAATDPAMGDANSTYMSHDGEVVARHQIIDQVAATRT